MNKGPIAISHATVGVQVQWMCPSPQDKVHLATIAMTAAGIPFDAAHVSLPLHKASAFHMAERTFDSQGHQKQYRERVIVTFEALKPAIQAIFFVLLADAGNFENHTGLRLEAMHAQQSLGRFQFADAQICGPHVCVIVASLERQEKQWQFTPLGKPSPPTAFRAILEKIKKRIEKKVLRG